MIEALIIYLAVGAPIGVYALARSKSALKQDLIALLTFNILLWPVFASLEFVPRSSSRQGPNYFADGRHNSAVALEQVRSDFKASLEEFGDRSFRRVAFEDFERFAALSTALSRTTEEPAIPAVFEVTAHPNSILAAKCLSRKNRRKLTDHRNRSHADLIALAVAFTPKDRKAFEAAIETAKTDLHNPTIS